MLRHKKEPIQGTQGKRNRRNEAVREKEIYFLLGCLASAVCGGLIAGYLYTKAYVPTGSAHTGNHSVFVTKIAGEATALPDSLLVRPTPGSEQTTAPALKVK